MNEKILQEISRKVVGTVALRVVKKGKAIYFEKFEFPEGWNKISISEVRKFSDRHIREWLNKQNKFINAQKAKKAIFGLYSIQSSE